MQQLGKYKATPRRAKAAVSIATALLGAAILCQPGLAYARVLEAQKPPYRFTETDDRSGDSAAPIIDRPEPDRSLETAAFPARN